MPDLIIKGGTVVNATGTSVADVVVDGETISALLAPGVADTLGIGDRADRVIDATGKFVIDYGFHQIIGGVDDESLKAMENLVDEGITSYKLFMAYPGVFYSDDAQILRAMQKAADLGLMTMMHAENGPAIDVLAEQLYNAGK